MGFARHVLATYLVRLCLIPIGLINGVLVARWLGPSGQGVFVAVSAYLTTAAMLGILGLPAAITRSVAENRDRAAATLANARLVGLISGGLCIAGLLTLRRVRPGAFEGISPGLLLLAALALPATLISSQFHAVLQGLARVRQFNAVDALERLLLFASAVVVLLWLDLGVTALIAGTTIIALIKLTVFHVQLRPWSFRLRPDFGLLGTLKAISARAYLASLLAFLVLRSDIMLVHGLLGASSTGVYSVAVQLTTLMLALPSSIGTLLLPRIAAAGSTDSARFTARLCRHVVPIVVLGCLAIGATAIWLIEPLYGEAYSGAVICVWILLPGIFCMSLQLILAHDLAGRDYPVFLTVLWFVLLALNVGLNVIWLPRFGIAGAAASSTLAYTLALLLVLRYWLRRFPDVGLGQLLLLDRDELRSLPGRLWSGLFPQFRGGGNVAR